MDQYEDISPCPKCNSIGLCSWRDLSCGCEVCDNTGYVDAADADFIQREMHDLELDFEEFQRFPTEVFVSFMEVF